MHAISTNQIIGSYRIIGLLGEGGMGAVYEAVHTTLNRRVAIKTLHPQYADDPILAARFLQEAKAANLIQHPGVVQIFEFGQIPGGPPYFIMEYLEGETLSARIRRAAKKPSGRLGTPGLVACSAVARVCAVVHKQGLVHRDLKPANIMIVPDPDLPGGERFKLLDFGIVKAAQTGGEADGSHIHAKTRTGSMLGTPQYMAPEQWRSQKQIDGKADVYALGVIHYQILTGRLPFDHDDFPVLGMMHCFEAPRPLSDLDPSLRPDVVSLGMKMLEKEPAQRPTMSEVANALGRILATLSDAEHHPAPIVLNSPPSPMTGLAVTVDPRLVGEPAPERPASPAPVSAKAPLHDRPQTPGATAPPGSKRQEVENVPDPLVGVPTAPMRAPSPAAQRLLASPTAPTLGSPSGLTRLVLPVLLLASMFAGSTWVAIHYWGTPPLPRAKDLGRSEAQLPALHAADLATLPDQQLAPAPDDLALSESDDLASPKASELDSQRRPPSPVPHIIRKPVSKPCEPISSTANCTIGPNLTMNQRDLVIEAFRLSAAKLCYGERLVLDGLPKLPRVSVVPPSMQRDSGAVRALTLTLRGLLGRREFPPQVEVRCDSH